MSARDPAHPGFEAIRSRVVSELMRGAHGREDDAALTKREAEGHRRPKYNPARFVDPLTFGTEREYVPEIGPEFTREFCEHLMAGHSIANACVLSRVTVKTVQAWLRQGRSGEQPFADFADSVRRAALAPLDMRLRLQTQMLADPELDARLRFQLVEAGLERFRFGLGLTGADIDSPDDEDEDEEISATDAIGRPLGIRIVVEEAALSKELSAKWLEAAPPNEAEPVKGPDGLWRANGQVFRDNKWEPDT